MLLFPALFAAFTAGLISLRRLFAAAAIRGLPAFLICCLPMPGVIAGATVREQETGFAALLRNAVRGYGFIRCAAAVAGLLGLLRTPGCAVEEYC